MISTDIPRKLRASRLHVGNRIVGDDGTTATVTAFEVTGEWVHYATDTGAFVSMPLAEARTTTLNVIV